MVAALSLLVKPILLRYLGASVVALAVDVSVFLALLAVGMLPPAASALGYGLGVIAHWLISSRSVFGEGVADRGPARTVQKAMFVLSALVGLALTAAIVALGMAAAVDPRIAKLGAIAASFLVTWLLRSRIIFTAPPGV